MEEYQYQTKTYVHPLIVLELELESRAGSSLSLLELEGLEKINGGKNLRKLSNLREGMLSALAASTLPSTVKPADFARSRD